MPMKRRKLRKDEQITYEYLPNLGPDEDVCRFAIYGDTSMADAALSLKMWRARIEMWGQPEHQMPMVQMLTDSATNWIEARYTRGVDPDMYKWYARTFTEFESTFAELNTGEG